MSIAFTDNPVLGKFTGDRATRAPTNQLYAVSKLVGYCEAICSSGLVGELMERKLRTHIAETLSAFNMEPHQEAVKSEMERS
jgi:hypothetical protein